MNKIKSDSDSNNNNLLKKKDKKTMLLFCLFISQKLGKK